jgi:hypothetical protein
VERPTESIPLGRLERPAASPSLLTRISTGPKAASAASNSLTGVEGAEIRLDGLGPAAGLPDRADDVRRVPRPLRAIHLGHAVFGRIVDAQVAHKDEGATGGQGFGRGSADPVVSPGDDRDTALDPFVSHGRHSSFLSTLARLSAMASIMTTLGPMRADELGMLLPHEHVFVDLRTWDQPGYAEADPAAVVALMGPRSSAPGRRASRPSSNAARSASGDAPISTVPCRPRPGSR